MAKITNVAQDATTNVEVDNTVVSQILDRLNRLEKENAELREKWVNGLSKAKERLKWPRKASYWLWAGVPILAYKSVKKNEEYDYLYKDGNGTWINNHFIQLTLASGEKVKPVLRDSFDSAKVLSEKMEFGCIEKSGDKVSKITEKNITSIDPAKWVFETEDYGTIEVDFNCIN